MQNDERLSPVAQELVPELREHEKIETRGRALTVAIVASVAAVIVGLVWVVASFTSADAVLKREGEIRDQKITSVQDQLKNVCRKVENPDQLTPEERDGCYRAENSIAPPAPPAPPAQPTQGLTVGEIRGLIADQLAAVPRPLTVDQVTAIAANAAQANKPKDGPPPTPEQLALAVSSFCAGDTCVGPQGPKGEPGQQGTPGSAGADGKDAPPVTDEQIRARVLEFCAANNNCQGPVGPAGVGVKSLGPFVREIPSDPLSQCRLEYTLTDLTTGYINAPSSFCLPT